MARSHARLYTAIWTDEDFRTLTADAQRVFMLVLSQHDLSWAGVAPYTPRRWANMAGDTKPARIGRAIAELAERRYLVVDEDTDEVWIRTFVRHDRVLDQPNVTKAMWADFEGIQSEAIREAFRTEYSHLFGNPSPNPSGKGSPKATPDPSTDPGGKGKRDSPVSSSPSPTPTPTPAASEHPPDDGEPGPVAPYGPGGGDDRTTDLDEHRRRKRLIERAADQQTDHTRAAENPKAYRAAIVKRLAALWDSWPPELIATIGDSDLLIALAAQEERPRDRRPPGSGTCVFCAGTGTYRWGDGPHDHEPCPNGCPTAEGASA